MKKDYLFNPCICWAYTWLTTIILIQLNVSKNISTDINWAYLLVLFPMFLYFRSFKIKRIMSNEIVGSFKDFEFLTIQLKWTVPSWYFLAIADAIYSDGFPMTRFLVSGDADYARQGIPTVKGLEYTLFLFNFCIYTYMFFYNHPHRKKLSYRIVLITLIFFPFLMFARGLLINAILQSFCFCFFRKKSSLKFKNIIFCMISLTLFVLLFGIIGDNRSEIVNPFGSYVNDEWRYVFEFLPTGFVWLYMYTTSGFNNVILTIMDVKPDNNILLVFYNLIPGVLKNVFFDREASLTLVTDDSLNVSSFFALYVSSFGVTGGMAGGAFLLGYSCYVYNKINELNHGDVLIYSLLYSCIILSVFFDSLMTVSTVFQIFLYSYISRKIKLANLKKKTL